MWFGWTGITNGNEKMLKENLVDSRYCCAEKSSFITQAKVKDAKQSGTENIYLLPPLHETLIRHGFCLIFETIFIRLEKFSRN